MCTGITSLLIYSYKMDRFKTTYVNRDKYSKHSPKYSNLHYYEINILCLFI